MVDWVVNTLNSMTGYEADIGPGIQVRMQPVHIQAHTVNIGPY